MILSPSIPILPAKIQSCYYNGAMLMFYPHCAHAHTRTHTCIDIECHVVCTSTLSTFYHSRLIVKLTGYVLVHQLSIAFGTCQLPPFTLLLGTDCAPKNCMNGGTQDPSTCDCICPPEYTGELCESEFS